jgi:hypothetical protein
MLMTTGTGAFGLNLTAANRIFIVELQWNPSVENQAIARAIRLRQRDKVVVIRYMMAHTVEQVRLGLFCRTIGRDWVSVLTLGRKCCLNNERNGWRLRSGLSGPTKQRPTKHPVDPAQTD